MPRAMALKKFSIKRARKTTAGEGSSAEHQRRFEAIKDWFFLKERQVKLAEGEYPEFQAEVSRRHWTQLTEPMSKYDPEIVMEFYANAWPTKEGVMNKRSWVRGQWIPYDEDAINQFPGHPLILEDGQHCEYAKRRSQISGFDEEAISQLLCSLGQDFVRSVTERRVSTAAEARPAATASSKRTTIASTSAIVPRVHLSSHAEDGAPDARGEGTSSPG
ncbi:hypothetical protein HKD37_04G010642 [Glycine soja]